MLPRTRLAPATGAGLSPFLFCNEITVAADGASLVCPQCADANLHLDAVHFAIPSDEHYTPTVGLSIDPDTGGSHRRPGPRASRRAESRADAGHRLLV